MPLCTSGCVRRQSEALQNEITAFIPIVGIFQPKIYPIQAARTQSPLGSIAAVVPKFTNILLNYPSSRLPASCCAMCGTHLLFYLQIVSRLMYVQEQIVA